MIAVAATAFTRAHVNANTVGTALTQWAEQGHAPDGGAWDQYWAMANDSVTSAFRSASANEHLALLSEWRAHQRRLDVKARTRWYQVANDHYQKSLAARPLSAAMWGQFAYSGLGSLARAERVNAVDRALELGHGREDIQQNALMTLLADPGLGAKRLAARVELVGLQREDAAFAVALLERAADSVSPGDPRVSAVRGLVVGQAGSTVADGVDD